MAEKKHRLSSLQKVILEELTKLPNMAARPADLFPDLTIIHGMPIGSPGIDWNCSWNCATCYENAAM